MAADRSFDWRSALLAVLSLGVAWRPAAAAELASHRADYTIRLDAARPGGLFLAVRGRMSMGLEKTCDGWIITQDLSMELETAGGEVVEQRLRFAAWESLGGETYRFISRSVVNGVRDELQGRARIGVAGGPGQAVYDLPEKRTITLPKGTMFPISHTAWLIDRARAGDRQAPRILFDGIDDQGPQEVTTFIGPPIASPGDAGKVAGPLVEGPGWTMRAAFYPLGSLASAPDFEVEVLQLDNGVAPRMLMDYRDYVLILDLERIEPIAPPDCG